MKKYGMNSLEDFVTLTQNELFGILRGLYEDKAISERNGFILVPGQAPVMLLAHLDTVHKETVRQICVTQDGNILMSPQGIGGDDRCGVYALVTAHKRSAVKPWLLFTCDEEIGGKGAEKFCESHAKGELPKELNELKMLIEIDRKGSKDAVYYNCENDDFEKYISGKGFVTDFGSFSDISLVAPELGAAAVNLSSGYYNAHTLHEYIVKSELEATIRKVVKMVSESAAPNFPKYAYVEKPRGIDCLRDWYRMPKLDSRSRSFDVSTATVDEKEFEALSIFYDERELLDYCCYYGSGVIHQLYEEEFGSVAPEEVLAEYGINDNEPDILGM